MSHTVLQNAETKKNNTPDFRKNNGLQKKQRRISSIDRENYSKEPLYDGNRLRKDQ